VNFSDEDLKRLKDKKFIIERIAGVEGDCLAISFDNGKTGHRFCGPKPWGGGKSVQQWFLKTKDLFDAIPELDALLTRLEAAEAVVKHAAKHEARCRSCAALLNNWRTAIWNPKAAD
jgi:hypothetical protein